MREVVVLVLFFVSETFCSPTSEASGTYTFFKDGMDRPGPTMSFSQSLTSGVFEFQFRTFVDNALLLYQDDQQSDFMRMNIENGCIRYAQFNTFDERISCNVSDLRWHTVRIERYATHMKLVIIVEDDETQKEIKSSPPSLSSDLQLGGFPPSREADRDSIADLDAFSLYAKLNWRGYFLGCVRNIKYGKDKASMAPMKDLSSMRFHVAEGSCDVTECDKPARICKNKAKCTPNDKGLATCDCRWTGYEGSTCTEEALRLYLNGSYKVVYRWGYHLPVEKEQFTLRIKTGENNAKILVAKGKWNEKVILEIKDSEFVVTSDAGQGGDVLRMNVSTTQWYKVKYHRDGYFLSLVIDGRERNLTSKHHKYVRMDYYRELFVGDTARPFHSAIEVEDFIWQYEEDGKIKKVNFVRELFESYASSNSNYSIEPSGVPPRFNRELPQTNTWMNVSLTTEATVIDYCVNANKTCHANAFCSGTADSHECICKTGFTGDGIHACTDINECTQSPAPCHEHAQCSNMDGSYACSCKEGFTGNGYLNCTDVDECKIPKSCLGKCENSLGSYLCSCFDGFEGDGKHNCTDIDECAKNICGKNNQCRNTEGSYYCSTVCEDGYTGTEHDNCTDIDECVGPVCHSLAICVNTEGSFTCQCPQQYHGDGVSICLPNYPCDEFPCFLGLKCFRSENDSSTCESCPSFFVGDGVTCAKNKSKNVVSKQSDIVLKKETWTDELTNKNTREYKILASKLIGSV